MRVIDAALVRQLLPMSSCIEAMAEIMVEVSEGRTSIPPRSFSPVADGAGTLGIMPGSSRQPPVYGAKIISLHPENPGAGRPAIQGFVALFDPATGAPMAVLDGAEITAIRTAAASALATRVLARSEASTLGVLGTGVQAVRHLEAICAVRKIERAVVWGRNHEKAQRLAAEQSERLQLAITGSADPELAAGCDVVCTVTAAVQPILRSEWVQPGAHVNLVGAHTPQAREAESALLQRAAIYVDLWQSAQNEAGDILLPIAEGAFDWAHVRGEIGEVLQEALPGRDDERQITVYKSLGIVAQDLAAAWRVWRAAAAAGLGVEVPLAG